MTHNDIETLLQQAEDELAQSQYNEATLTSQKIISSTNDTEELHLRALVILLEVCRKQQIFNDARPLCEKIITIANTIGSDHGMCASYSVLGFVARHEGDNDYALQCFERALQYSRKTGNVLEQARALTNVGLVFRYLGQYNESIDALNSAITLFELLHNENGLALAFGNIGLTYEILHVPDKALDYLSRALAIHERSGNTMQIAGTLSNIGNYYKTIGDSAKDLEYSQRALQCAEEANHKPYIATILVNIGNSHKGNGNYEVALDYLTKGLGIFIELNDNVAIAKTVYNIGVVYNDMGHYDEALEYFFRALQSHVKHKSRQSEALVLGSIGGVYSKKDYEGYSFEQAEEYLTKAVSLSRELGAKHQLREIHQLLFYLYRDAEQWREGLLHLEQYQKLHEEIRGDESIRLAQQMEDRRKVEEAERDRQIKLARFQEQEKILHNILPAHIAERMLNGESRIADSFKSVSIFFSDIVGFTKLSQNISANELVMLLNELFTEVDRLARKHGLEKIKTIGDAYMAVAGAPIEQHDHAARAAHFALDVVHMMSEYRLRTSRDVHIRVGLHSGSVVAGVIGENKFLYDLWGDAVNTANRMESHGESGKIHVSEEFKNDFSRATLPESTGIRFHERGTIEIKGKGFLTTYFLEKG